MNKIVTLGLLSVGLWLTGCSQPLEGIIGKKDFVKAVTGVSLNKDTLTLYTGDKVGIDDTGTLTPTVAPGNATNKKVTWTSSAPAVATVSDAGVVTAVTPGTATITVKTEDGNKTATCNVEVVNWFQEMVLATLNSVTIDGSSAYSYDNSTSEYYKGVFVENRTVTLSPFRIAKYETTYELWYEVRQWATNSVARGLDVYTFAHVGQEGGVGPDGGPPTTAKTEPVTRISWRDAVVWCNAYSEMSGKDPVYYTSASYDTVLRISTKESGTNAAADKAVMKAGANGYRLPTEAEWEYAARGGGTPSTTGSFAYKWAGTNTDEDILDGLRYYAWYSVNSSGDTHPVGGKTANGAQLYDMSGNVWEWCWDRRGTISTVPVTDPTGPALGSDRVFRGGSWNLYASACAVAARSNALSSDLRPDLGFRVACGN